MEKLKPSCLAAGNVKWFSHWEKQLTAPQKVKQSYHMTQQFHA